MDAIDIQSLNTHNCQIEHILAQKGYPTLQKRPSENTDYTNTILAVEINYHREVSSITIQYCTCNNDKRLTKEFEYTIVNLT